MYDDLARAARLIQDTFDQIEDSGALDEVRRAVPDMEKAADTLRSFKDYLDSLTDEEREELFRRAFGQDDEEE